MNPNPEHQEHEPDPNALPAPLDYTEFEVMPTTKPRPIIKDLFDDSSRMVFGGPAKSFKSWGLCDLALSLAGEVPWLGFDTYFTPGLFINFELKPFYFQLRLNAIKTAKRIAIEPGALEVWNLRGYEFKLQPFLDQISFCIERTKRQAVFIDPFYKLLPEGKDERVSADLNPILLGFNQINRKTGASVVTAMHFIKGNAANREPADRISGGGNIVRDPDVLLTFTGHENKGESVLDFTLRDHPPLDAFTVKWAYPLLTRSNSDPSKIKQPRGHRHQLDPDLLLEIIANHDNELNTTQLIAKAIDQLHWARSTIIDKLNQLRNDKKAFVSKMNDKWNIKP